MIKACVKCGGEMEEVLKNNSSFGISVVNGNLRNIFPSTEIYWKCSSCGGLDYKWVKKESKKERDWDKKYS